MAAPTATTSSGWTPRLALHGGHARHASDEHHLFDVLDAQLGEAKRLLADREAASDEIAGHLLELVAAQRGLEVDGALGARHEERQLDLGGGDVRELALGLLRRLPHARERERRLRGVHARALAQTLDHPLDDAVVEVLAAQVRVARRRDDVVADLRIDPHHRDVEGATAHVVDDDRLGLLARVSVRDRGGRGLVEDAQDVEAGDAARVAHGLSLVVVEVRGHRHDRVLDRLTELLLGERPHLLQQHGGDLGDREELAAELDAHVVVGPLHDAVRAHLHGVLHLRRVPCATDEALGGVDRVLRVGDLLAHRELTDETLAVFGHGDDGRRRLVAGLVVEDLCARAVHDGDATVGRS
jgi:hypothetical protein